MRQCDVLSASPCKTSTSASSACERNPPPGTLWFQSRMLLGTVTIPCHSVILSARSQYIAAAFKGPFIESQKRTIELQMGNEQEVLDLQLLLKLSYGGSYTRDRDHLLNLEIRMRLAILANAYEFRECVDEVFVSFVKRSIPGKALSCLLNMPEELRNHPGMAGFATSVIEDSLNEDVKDLSLDAMAALLKSDHLDRGVENEAYYLLGAWIHRCPHLRGGDERGGSEKTQLAKRTEAFKILAEHVRFEHMTTDLLANIVATCPLTIASGLSPWIMHCSLAAHDTKWKATNKYQINLGRNERAYGESEWKFNTCFKMEELLTLKKDLCAYLVATMRGVRLEASHVFTSAPLVRSRAIATKSSFSMV